MMTPGEVFCKEVLRIRNTDLVKVGGGAERSMERVASCVEWNVTRTTTVSVPEGGVTAAAHRSERRRPTVSDGSWRLETKLGKRLVDRGPGRFRVAEAGNLLYRECVEIYGSVSRLSVLLRDVEDEVAGEVRIAMA